MQILLFFSIAWLALFVCIPTEAVLVKHIPGLDTLHFDVEPHTLAQWSSNWTAVAVQYLDLLHKLHALTYPAGLYLSVDLNPSYDGGQCGGCFLSYRGKNLTLMEHVVEAVDEINIMDYVPVAQLISAAQNEIDACQKLGKRAVIVLNFISNGPASETLWDEGVTVLESSLDSVWHEFREVQGKTALRGTAVHTFAAYWAASPAVVAAGPGKMRDLYWWCSSLLPNVSCNIYDGGARTLALNFSLSHAVAQLYIDAPAIVALTPPTGDQNLLTNFIGSLYANNIRSQLIFGAASWALAANHDLAIAKVNSSLVYIGAYGNVSDIVLSSTSSSPSVLGSSSTSTGSSSNGNNNSGSASSQILSVLLDALFI